MRKHPRLLDAVLAGAVFLYNLPIQAGYVQVGFAPAHPPHLTLVLSVGLCLPYLWRRDHPAGVFAVMALVCLAQWSLGVAPLAANVMLVFGLYDVASRSGRWVSITCAGVTGLGAALFALRWEDDPTSVGINLVYGSILIVSVWIWGYTIGVRRAYLEGLRKRAAHLERERDHQAQLAAAAERARIAREMHDVVSHSLSVMVVQADGATHILRDQPERAERALVAIQDAGRTALEEMRRMLGVLRDGESEHGSYTPQPGTAQLEQLVRDARSWGLPVELTVRGAPRALPTGMELAVYRTVQEALTNVRKHAGPDVSRVRVRLRYTDHALVIGVLDDGRGPATAPDGAPGGGHGLVGMRERIAAYDGSLHSGPRSGGGFEVLASLPLEAQGGESPGERWRMRPGR